MNFNDLKKKALSNSELKQISGASGEFNCYCNGHYTGTSSSASGCAALCSACVDNGGCQEQK